MGSPASAAWRALVARLGVDALREAAHIALDAAFDAAANDAPRRGAVRPPVVPPAESLDPALDEVARQRAAQALQRRGIRKAG